MKNQVIKYASQHLFIFIGYLFFINTAFGQTDPSNIRELKFDKTIERKIVKNERHDYSFKLSTGQNLFIELQELIYNVKIEIFKSGDKKLVAETDFGGGVDRENLIFSAETEGEYFLRISVSENQFGNGEYRFSARLIQELSEADKSRTKGLRLLAEADTLQKENTAVNIREAIKRREQALIIWQNLGDKYWEGRTLDRLGSAHNALLENNKAIEYFDRTLPIVKKSGDKPLEAATLNTVGLMNNVFGEYKIAIEYHTQALQISQKLKSKIGIMSSQNFLGNAYLGLKDYVKANDYFQKSLQMAQKDGNKNFKAAGFWFLGIVLDAQNEKSKALEKYNQALVLWREIKNQNNTGLVLVKIGTIQHLQNNVEESLKNLNIALKLFQSIKNRAEERNALYQIAEVLDKKGEFELAIDNIKKVTAYYKEFNFKAAEIIFLNWLSLRYEMIGKYNEAIEYADMCLKAEESIPERTSAEMAKAWQKQMKDAKALTLITLGRIFENSKDFDKALINYQKTLEYFEVENTKDYRMIVSLTLAAIAQIHEFSYEYDKALVYKNRALKIAEEDADISQIGRIQNSIGLIYGKLDNKDSETEFFEKALATFKSIETKTDLDKSFEAAILNNIGLFRLHSGKPTEALDFFNRSLKIQNDINSIDFLDQKADTLGKLASVYSYLGENQKSIDLYDQAHELFKKVPDHIKALSRNRTSEADILNGLGTVYSKLGENQKALEKYNKAFDISLKAKVYDFAAIALTNIASVHYRIGEKQKALELFEKVLQFSRDSKDKSLEIDTLGYIGLIYFDSLMDKQKAIVKYDQALSLAREISNKKKEAIYLNHLARSYGYLSENEKFFEYINKALDLYKQLEDKSGIAITTNNLANFYSTIGERGKSLELYEKAIAISREIKDKSGETTYLSNLAYDYSELGEDKKAFELNEMALKLSRETGFKRDQAQALTGIGNFYFSLGNKEKKSEYYIKALGFFEQSLKLSRESEDKDGENGSLSSLGRVYENLGDFEKASQHLNESLSLSKKYQNKYQEGGVYRAFGLLFEKKGEFDNAIGSFQQSVTIARTINDKDIEAKALRGLMSVWKKRGNARLAIFYGKQSVNIYQDLRGSIRSLKRESQNSFRDKVTGVYRDLADLLIEAGRLTEAEEVLAMLKEQEAFDFVRRDGTEAKNLLSQKVFQDTREAVAVAKYAELIDVLIIKSRRRNELDAKLILEEKEKEELKKLTAEIDTANEGINRFFAELESEFTKKVEDKVTITSDTIRSLMADLREVRAGGEKVILVSTYLLPNRYRAIINDGTALVDRKSEYKSLSLDVKAVNQKILEFKQALENPEKDPRDLGKELYDIFIKPLEKDLKASKAETILWSLDGNLRYIPIAALWDGEKYLAERYQNVIVTLGRTSKLFDEPNGEDWRVLGLGVSKKHEGFSELSAVPDEIRAIVRDTRNPQFNQGVLNGTGLLDADFTEERFVENLKLRSSTDKFNVVHLATHFRLRGKSDESGLLLGNGKVLSYYDINKKSDFDFTKVELLTLSACETGISIGDSNDGGEVESLGLMVQRKGAKSVLATLWKVADSSTAMLMSEFYRLRQANPTWTKAKSLREAQLAMISGKLNPVTEGCENRAELAGEKKGKKIEKDKCRQFAHPYYWSPFILIGNWR